MLKLLTLDTINKIFKNQEKPISALSKMIYINCLTFHFENLSATFNNACSFELFNSDIDIKKFQKNFVELHKAGYVIMKDNSVYFENLWGQLIDRSKLKKDAVFQTNFNTIDWWWTDLFHSKTTEENIMKNCKITQKQYQDNLALFINEQQATEKTYNNLNEVTRHFFYWTQKKFPSINQPKSHKILGM
jgi:hypothetical protein